MNSKLEQLLTKSAKQELERHLAEEKIRILKKAYKKSSSMNCDVEEISLRDILEATDSVKFEKYQISKKIFRNNSISQILIILGFLYLMMGTSSFIFRDSLFNFGLSIDIGMLLSMLGFGTITIAFYFLVRRTTIRSYGNEKYSSFSEFSIVERWTMIEKLARDLIRRKKHKEPKSFNEILYYLKNDLLFSKQEQMDLEELLKLRNNILHNSTNLNPFERKKYLEIADEFINRLEKESNKNIRRNFI